MEQPLTEPEPEEARGRASPDSEGSDAEDDADAIKKEASESTGEKGQGLAGEAAAEEAVAEPFAEGADAPEGRWQGLRRRLSIRRARFSSAPSGEAPDEADLLRGDEPQPEAEGDEGCGAEGADPSCGASAPWHVVDAEGIVLTVEGTTVERQSVESKVEQLLTWMLAPAIYGIPKLGVLAASGRADELLAANGRDVEAAVREVVAGSESSVSALVLNFCLERIPILGCPTVLLRSTWGNLRAILIIAAMYGHDLEAPRVQHEALLCLVPHGEGKDTPPSPSKGEQSTATLVGDTAAKVARMLIKSAVRRATGLQAAVDCFELASLLYSSVGSEAVDEDGFVHVTATPASTARDFFKRKSFASCAMLWCSLPLLVLGSIAPAVFSAMMVIPASLRGLQALGARLPPACRASAPALLLALLGLAASLRAFCRLAAPPARQRRRNLWRRALAALRERPATHALEEAWPRLVTTGVFTLHAVLPALSMYSALAVVLHSWAPGDGSAWAGWEVLHRLSTMALGFFNMFSIILHQVEGDPDEAAAEPRRSVRCLNRALHVLMAAARGCCVFAAWTYMSLALDFVLTTTVQKAGLRGLGEEETLLGVVRPLAWTLGAAPGFGSLYKDEALRFTLHLVSVASQQRLVQQLSRREVLLRLIGAEKMMASTLCLLLKGVQVACSSSTSANPIGEFLESVAPPPLWCVAIVAIRQQALLLGAALVCGPKVVASGVLGTHLCFALGLGAGVYAASVGLSLWYENRVDLESPGLRLIFLIPGGVSSRAKGLFRGALVGARTRAVQMMAMGVLQRVMRWWTSRRA